MGGGLGGAMSGFGMGNQMGGGMGGGGFFDDLSHSVGSLPIFDSMFSGSGFNINWGRIYRLPMTHSGMLSRQATNCL